MNNSEIIKRIKIILDYYALSASKFADTIQVQRSSISHLLSGRNKPSLDFILKIVNQYDTVSLDWLLLGKGNFPYNPEQISNTPTPPQEVNLFNQQEKAQAAPKPTALASENNDSANETKQLNAINTTDTKAIEQIVIFYRDGSFKNYS